MLFGTLGVFVRPPEGTVPSGSFKIQIPSVLEGPYNRLSQSKLYNNLTSSELFCTAKTAIKARLPKTWFANSDKEFQVKMGDYLAGKMAEKLFIEVGIKIRQMGWRNDYFSSKFDVKNGYYTMTFGNGGIEASFFQLPVKGELAEHLANFPFIGQGLPDRVVNGVQNEPYVTLAVQARAKPGSEPMLQNFRLDLEKVIEKMQLSRTNIVDAYLRVGSLHIQSTDKPH